MQSNISNFIGSRCIDISPREIPEGTTLVEAGSEVGRSIFRYALSVTALGKPCRALAIDKSGGAPGNDVQAAFSATCGGIVRSAFDETFRLSGLLDIIEVSGSDSADSAKPFADGSVQGVFIHAGHSTEAVRRDFAAWHPKFAPGSLSAGHDIDAPSVNAASPQPYIAAGRCEVKQ